MCSYYAVAICCSWTQTSSADAVFVFSDTFEAVFFFPLFIDCID